jgi:fucose permease
MILTMSRLIVHPVCRQEVGEIVNPNNVEEEGSPMKKFGQMMTHKAVHLLSLFLMVYIGVEVTIGGIIHFYIVAFNKKLNNCKSGWTASFLMLVRGGGPSSGYVSTGFFGGKHLVTVVLKPFLFIYIY